MIGIFLTSGIIPRHLQVTSSQLTFVHNTTILEIS